MNFILESERLILRELSINDAESFFLLNEDEEVLKHTGDLPFTDISKARDFLSKYDQYKRFGFGRWAVILKENNSFIGWCGLKQNEKGEIDIGFRFFRKTWNKGYATEAAKASLDFAFENLNIEKVIARASINNIASIKVLEKIGMIFSHTEIEEEMGEIRVYKKLQLSS